jgi:hypothetical protein
MFRLSLLNLTNNVGSANVGDPVAARETGPTDQSFISRWIPVPSTETTPSVQRIQILQSEISPPPDGAHPGRMLLKIAFMAALFLGGYLTGRFAILDSATTADTNANQATGAQSAPEPPAPEPPSPLVWGPQVAAVPPETSAVLSPELNIPKPASAPNRDARPLRSDEVREVQAWLNVFGFDAGSVDGFAGPQTTAAVKRYRSARQMEETGALDRSVLQQLRQQVGQ